MGITFLIVKVLKYVDVLNSLGVQRIESKVMKIVCVKKYLLKKILSKI